MQYVTSVCTCVKETRFGELGHNLRSLNLFLLCYLCLTPNFNEQGTPGQTAEFCIWNSNHWQKQDFKKWKWKRWNYVLASMVDDTKALVIFLHQFTAIWPTGHPAQHCGGWIFSNLSPRLGQSSCVEMSELKGKFWTQKKLKDERWWKTMFPLPCCTPHCAWVFTKCWGIEEARRLQDEAERSMKIAQRDRCQLSFAYHYCFRGFLNSSWHYSCYL